MDEASRNWLGGPGHVTASEPRCPLAVDGAQTRWGAERAWDTRGLVTGVILT